MYRQLFRPINYGAAFKGGRLGGLVFRVVAETELREQKRGREGERESKRARERGREREREHLTIGGRRDIDTKE